MFRSTWQLLAIWRVQPTDLITLSLFLNLSVGTRYSDCFMILPCYLEFHHHQPENMSVSSGNGTNLKVGHMSGAQRQKKTVSCPSIFVALQVQLVISVSALVMGSTVWTISCFCFALLFFNSRYPHAQAFVKVGGARLLLSWRSFYRNCMLRHG